MKKQNLITWSSKQIKVADIKPTPTNYKIKSELGRARLTESLNSFGLAGNVVVNQDLTLIDGNSRLEQAKERGEKTIWASIPSRKLSPAEFKEMSALFDFAKAGEVDIDRIKTDLGTSEKFFEKYRLEVSDTILDKLGKYASKKPALVSGAKKLEAPTVTTTAVTLIFTEASLKKFRVAEEKLMKRYATTSTGDTVLKAFAILTK